MTRDPHWFAASLAWNDYTAALHRGASDADIRWYRERYERVRAARWEFWWRVAAKPGTAAAGDGDTAIVLAQPRRVTSSSITKMGSHGLFAFLLTATAMLGSATPAWAMCAAAPLVIYIWWLLTGATIRAAAQFDEHPIPPARVLSEGPR